MSRITIENLTSTDLKWFVETAAVNMLQQELKREELINIPNLYNLAEKSMKEGTAFITKAENCPIGALGALLVNNVYNPNLLSLVELFWYVVPEYRNTRAGALLFNRFNQKGAECANEATLSLLDSSDINIKSLERRGFILSEFAFKKEYRRI